MTSAAKREMRIAVRHNILLTEPQSYEEIVSAIKAIMSRNLPNLLMYFNGEIERLGYTYHQGWVKA